MGSITQKIRQRLTLAGKDQRTTNVVRNVVMSAGMKVVSLLCSLLVVPMTIDYLNAENYGIWMAITSILFWVAFCDIGLGNGMRNYMAEAIAKNDFKAARSYFSTAVVLLSLIALLMGIIAMPVIYFSDLNLLFNTSNVASTTLVNAVMMAVACALLHFVVKNVGMVYVALQKYAVNDLIVFLGNVSSAVAIYLLTITTEGNLVYVVIAYAALPLLFYLFAIIPLLRKYPMLKPDLDSMNMDAARKVVQKGMGFFIMQITSCLVIFGSANVFLSHYCGPEQVTVYNVAYKVFFTLVTAYTIFLSPLWNAYTDAAAKKDYDWIRKTFKRSLGVWLLTVLGGIVLLAFSGRIYETWIGESVTVPFEVSVCVMAYICVFNLNNCVTYLINGLNKIRVEIITSVATTIFYLIAVFFVKGNYGIIGISVCMIIAYLLMDIVHFYQCYLFINNKATGVWNR